MRTNKCTRGIEICEGTVEGTVIGASEYYQKAQNLTFQARFQPWAPVNYIYISITYTELVLGYSSSELAFLLNFISHSKPTPVLAQHTDRYVDFLHHDNDSTAHVAWISLNQIGARASRRA
jgi:hypothetical protein